MSLLRLEFERYYTSVLAALFCSLSGGNEVSGEFRHLWKDAYGKELRSSHNHKSELKNRPFLLE